MVLGIVSVNNRSKAEDLMKQWFSNHGALLVQGNEYFEVSDMNEAYYLFTDANLKDTNEDDAILFEPGEWIHGETFPDELEEQETALTVAEFVREKFDDINRFYLSDVN